MSDATFTSPVINTESLPSEGSQIIPPTEQKLTDTFTPVVIPDKTLPDTESSGGIKKDGSDQRILGVLEIGWAIKLDGANNRIIINDGNTDRIIIGKY